MRIGLTSQLSTFDLYGLQWEERVLALMLFPGIAGKSLASVVVFHTYFSLSDITIHLRGVQVGGVEPGSLST